MINVKELRVGNWVICNGKHKEVKYISKNGIFIEGKSAIFEPYPIPLSPDILLACGFKKVLSDVFKIALSDANTLFLQIEFRGNDSVIGIKNEAGYITINGFRKYNLHQLQNLFYDLSREELNYKPV